MFKTNTKFHASNKPVFKNPDSVLPSQTFSTSVYIPHVKPYLNYPFHRPANAIFYQAMGRWPESVSSIYRLGHNPLSILRSGQPH